MIARNKRSSSLGPFSKTQLMVDEREAAGDINSYSSIPCNSICQQLEP